MTTYVLIAWFFVSTGGYASSNAVAFQEFSSKDSCEKAISLIYKDTSGIRATCVTK